jgi:DNA/RNA endonuclease YhcR with UshA esterase domain
VVTVGASSFTLKDEHGTLTITISNTTAFDGVKGIADLKAGMRVEVKGAQQTNGSIAAQRVHVEDSEHGD